MKAEFVAGEYRASIDADEWVLLATALSQHTIRLREKRDELCSNCSPTKWLAADAKREKSQALLDKVARCT